MSHYKFHYFDGRGAGELIRQIFKLAGQDFEDIRYTMESWPAAKPNMPFGQMPVLEFDGKMLPQSHAIARYLAKQFGFAGKDAFESAQVDALADQMKDFGSEVRPFAQVWYGLVEGDVEKLKNDIFYPAVRKHYPLFVKALKNNGTGFLVGNSVTWIDVLVAEGNHVIYDKLPECYSDYPELVTHFEKIHSIPQLKSWRETRPVTKF